MNAKFLSKYNIGEYGAFSVTMLAYAIVAATFVVRVIMYFKGHELWYDEAALAQSLVSRSFAALLATSLDSGQSAPALYCYLVKMFGALFHYSEGSLRIYSLFAFVGMLAVEYVLLKKAFNLNEMQTALALSITSLVDVYFRYANELKPYMGDAFWALAILLLYHFYIENKIGIYKLVSGYCLALLFSTPALFFIVGVFGVEFLDAAIKKDKEALKRIVKGGGGCFVFFSIYYMMWLEPAVGGMLNYWENGENSAYFFSFPLNSDAIWYNIKLLKSLFGREMRRYIPFAAIGLILSVANKNKISFAVGASLIIVFIASSIHRWIIIRRVCLFVYVLVVMYMFICFSANFFSRFDRGIFKVKYIFLIITAVFIWKNRDFQQFAGDKAYLLAEEANPLIAYIQECISDGEYAYIYHNAIWVVKYKNGYQSNRIGNVKYDNIIYGRNPYEWEIHNKDNVRNEIDRIIAAKRAYLLFYHYRNGGGIDKGLANLAAAGYLHKVGEFYQTPLYYFTMDFDDPKRNMRFDFLKNKKSKVYCFPD